MICVFIELISMKTRNILEEAMHWYSILLFYRFCANVDMVIMLRWMLYLHNQIKHILSIMKDERSTCNES